MPAVSSKFGPQFVGPFRVLERIGRLVYRLRLPPNMKIHDVVSVAQLEPTTDPASDQYGRRPPPPGPTVVDNEEEWEVEGLLSKRSRRIGRAKSKSTKYLVRWVAHGPEHDVWMTVKHLDHCQELIDEFEACQKEGVFTSIPKDHQRAIAVVLPQKLIEAPPISPRQKAAKAKATPPNTPIPGNEQRAIAVVLPKPSIQAIKAPTSAAVTLPPQKATKAIKAPTMKPFATMQAPSLPPPPQAPPRLLPKATKAVKQAAPPPPPITRAINQAPTPPPPQAPLPPPPAPPRRSQRLLTNS